MKLVRSNVRPSDDAVHQDGDVWLVSDTAGLVAEAVVLDGEAAVSAVPIRDDLDEKNPLRGKRALRNVAAGRPDVVVDVDGVLTTDIIRAATAAVLEPE